MSTIYNFARTKKPCLDISGLKLSNNKNKYSLIVTFLHSDIESIIVKEN